MSLLAGVSHQAGVSPGSCLAWLMSYLASVPPGCCLTWLLSHSPGCCPTHLVAVSLGCCLTHLVAVPLTWLLSHLAAVSRTWLLSHLAAVSRTWLLSHLAAVSLTWLLSHLVAVSLGCCLNLSQITRNLAWLQLQVDLGGGVWAFLGTEKCTLVWVALGLKHGAGSPPRGARAFLHQQTAAQVCRFSGSGDRLSHRPGRTSVRSACKGC